MNKKRKSRVYADLLDSPERLETMIQDRKKRRKVIQICFTVIAVSTLLVVVGSLGTEDSAGSSLAGLAIFLGVVLAFEFEWQLLHVLQRMAKDRMNPEPDDADNPCNPPGNSKNQLDD